MLSCRHLQIWKGIIACILQIYIANQGTPLTLCCKLVCPNCEGQHYANTDSFRHKQGASHYSGCTRSSILKKIILFREMFQFEQKPEGQIALEQQLQDGLRLVLSDTARPRNAAMNSIERSFLNFMNSRYSSRYFSDMTLNMIFPRKKGQNP